MLHPHSLFRSTYPSTSFWECQPHWLIGATLTGTCPLEWNYLCSPRRQSTAIDWLMQNANILSQLEQLRRTTSASGPGLAESSAGASLPYLQYTLHAFLHVILPRALSGQPLTTIALCSHAAKF